MTTTALILFLITYAFMLLLPRFRALVAWCAAALFLLLGILPLSAVPGAVDWNVLLMLCGTMGIVDLFIRSNMPTRLADRLICMLPSVKWVFVMLALFAGLVSAFIDNVATVLMLAPIGLALARKFRVSPVPVVLAIAVSSNLQGAATLVGDTTSILLGSHMGLNFADFFFYRGQFGMFWIVQAGALMTVPVLLFLFRKDRGRVSGGCLAPVSDRWPTVFLVGMVLTLIAVSFLPEKPALINGVVCMGYFVIALIRECLKKRNLQPVDDAVRALDYTTLLLLAALFLLIEGISRAGVIDQIGQLFTNLGGGNLFLTYTLIVWLSVLFSAFIDNIPYVAAMLPVIGRVAALMAVEPTVLYFGLLAGATLGGNLTPIGASANIAACGILRREGYQVSNGAFMKIGVPFTMAAVLTGYVLIWLLYA